MPALQLAIYHPLLVKSSRSTFRNFGAPAIVLSKANDTSQQPVSYLLTVPHTYKQPMALWDNGVICNNIHTVSCHKMLIRIWERPCWWRLGGRGWSAGLEARKEKDEVKLGGAAW